MSSPPSHPTTIFVRNLSHQTTNNHLSAHFSSIGPLRRALIVTDDATGLCKGFGFVHFALAQDASTALSQLNGSFLRGRKLNLHLAKPRQRSIQDGDGGLVQKDKQHKRSKKGAGVKGAVGMRTVLLTNTEGGPIEEEQIHHRLKGLVAPQNVVILPSPIGMRVMFDSWALAGKAASRLHSAPWDACIEALRGGKRTRLIVRNLPFRCSLAEVRDAFSKFAPVRQLRLEPARNPRQQRTRNNQGMGGKSSPKTGEEHHTGHDMVECAGFGFVEYFLVADAKFAMSKMNGAKVGGRVVAVDMSLGKSDYAKKLEAAEDDHEEDDGQEDLEDPNPDKVSGEKDTNDSEKEDSVIHSGEKEAKDERKKLSHPQSAESTPEELARTVFLRNLLFETSAPELWTAMAKEFGPVEQAVLVKHPVTQRPRGTAFVRFQRVEDANKAVTRGASGDTSKTRSAVAKPTGDGFVLQGRALLISRAVDRKSAREVDQEAKLGGKKVDPRNLRLAWIGQVKAGSAEARGLSERDMERREKSARMKRMNLSKNPNAFISDVRLSVKNIPKEFTDVMLKQMFLAVVERERKREKEKVATHDEGVGKGKSDGEGNTRNEKRAVRITHCKIVRDEGRNGRSKGYGFVTFERHEDALAGLHGVNNKEDVLDVMIKCKRKVLKLDEGQERYLRQRWGSGRRLDVEFSVEDQRSVRVIEAIKERGRKKAEENRKRKLEEGGTEETQRKRRKARMKKADKEEGGASGVGVEAKKVSRAEKKGALKRKRAQAVGEEKVRTGAGNGTGVERREEKGSGAGAGLKRRRKERQNVAIEMEDVTVEEKDGGRRGKRGRKGAADGGSKTDKLDTLVEAYKKKLTRGSMDKAARMGQAGGNGRVAELKRWFG